MPTGEPWSPNIRNCAYCKQPFELNKGNYYEEKSSRRKRRFHVGHLEEYLAQKLLAALSVQGRTQQEIVELAKRGIIQNAVKETIMKEYEYIPASPTGNAPVSRFQHETVHPHNIGQQGGTEQQASVSSYTRKKKQPDMTWLTGNWGNRR